MYQVRQTGARPVIYLMLFARPQSVVTLMKHREDFCNIFGSTVHRRVVVAMYKHTLLIAPSTPSEQLSTVKINERDNSELLTCLVTFWLTQLRNFPHIDLRNNLHGSFT